MAVLSRCSRSAAALAFGLLVLLPSGGLSSAIDGDMPLSADDECSPSAADGEDCGLSALQLKARQNQKMEDQRGEDIEKQQQTGCDGMPGCTTIMAFNKEFDTNVPTEMQQAMNEYSEWRTSDEGIKVAVTKDHYYEMYHGNVGSKLSQYMPQGMFGWHFNNDYSLVRKTATSAVIARTGSITFNLGWWRRSMFWNACVKALPSGYNFDFSNVTDFDDCQSCSATMEYTVKQGGLSGKEEGWKITDLVLLKLA